MELSSNHEEADTRLILHAMNAYREGYARLVVKCRDTDVFLLLIHHLVQLPVKMWMVSGTSNKIKGYASHLVAQQLPVSVRLNILGFHALTGCDTTSSFSGISKKTCWKQFLAHPELLSGVGRDGNPELAEKFVCLLYGLKEVTGIDDARRILFVKAKRALEMLPPTKDALELHVARSNYQATVDSC